MKPSLLKRLSPLARDPRVLALAGGGVLVAALAVLAAWRAGVTISDLRMWFDALLEFLRAHPLLLFFALAILPALPVPASALLVLAGVVYVPSFGAPLACAIVIAAMVLNMSWTYVLAAYPARHFVERLLHRLDIRIPVLSTGGTVRLITILRITPGFPFFVQNLVLGFLRVPFKLYLPLSAALCSISIVGFVVSGGAIFQGSFSLALAAVAFILIAVTLTGYLRKRLGARGVPEITPGP